MECLKSLTGESLTATDAFAVFGNAVTDLQTDYCVVLALPKTQMTMSDQSTAVVSKQGASHPVQQPLVPVDSS